MGLAAFGKLAIAGVLATSGLASIATGCSSSPEVPRYAMPYKAIGNYLAVYDGSDYRPIYMKGVNLAVAVPGTQPGEMAATREQYEQWLQMMWDDGSNVIRIYTLHYPRFYDALDKFNREHRERPIYVLHGIWLDEENVTGDLHDMNPDFDSGIMEVLDCAHGNCTVPERKGRAYGTYTTDMTPWVIGWLVGREVYSNENVTTNLMHPTHTSYEGKNFRVAKGNPTEVWWAKRLDLTVSYERERYGVERPVAVSSWPTLDPLDHVTEGPGSHEDEATLDLSNMEAPGAPAGYFVSFHIYPNYPDFMNDQPSYQDAADELGPNSYLGYLRELKEHYSHVPVLVAEFGVPTSWGNAHFGQSGMHHGSHDEVTQGLYTARMIRNIHESKYAGHCVFAWIDEWWKSTWIITPQAFPVERYKLWHNVMSPEQNYGVIAWDLDPVKYDKWPEVRVGTKVTSLRADVNAEYFHLKMKLASPLGEDERLVIGFDTYADDRGESVLPNSVRSNRRHELALDITGSRSANLTVTEAYDLYKIWQNEPDRSIQHYHSTWTDGKPWKMIRWNNKGERQWKDGQKRPATDFEAGRLRIRKGSDPATTLDSVVVDGDEITIRIPWMLLQFTDPSLLWVMDDNLDTPEREIAVSEGIGLSVSFRGELFETPRFKWEGWNEVPAVKQRKKIGYDDIWSAQRGMDVLR